MDFSAMIAAHLEHGAAVTVACVNVPLEQAHQFGVVQTAADGQITGFQEKPAVPLARADRPGWALGSMGIYLFDADFLYAVLAADARDGTSRHDFGADILPGIHPHYRVFACPFVDEATGADAYWRDVGTLDAYWAANLELAGVTPPLNLYDEDWPIRTIARQLPPAKFVFDEDDRRGIAIDSLVAGGCIVSGARIRRCVLSNNVHVDQGAELTDTVVLPDARIGAYSFIRNAVIDVACHIAPHTVIGFDTHADARRFHVSAGGVVLVCPHMLGQVARHAS
jgi:glucose-1-phosphate adenylyltransferase